MRLLDLLKSSADRLERSGVPDPLVDAELILLHAAQMERLRAYMDNPEVQGPVLSKVRRLLARREGGEPVQYIVGNVDFLGLNIVVGRGVLIPRPETELLAEEVILEIKDGNFPSMPRAQSHSGGPRMLDLCTGSGCIALAVAKSFPHAEIYGSDISRTAIRYAERNAAINGIANVRFLRGSLFGPLPEGEQFDIITANPPYIRRADMTGLQREIRDWEPKAALDGGEDGLDFHRKIISGAAKFLNDRGCLFLECGFGQARDLVRLAEKEGFRKTVIKKDLAGIERILKAGL